MVLLHRPRGAKPARGELSCQLVLTINQTAYAVRPLACDPTIAARAFRLNKADGVVYDVAQTPHGPRCDCPDFIFRRDGLDPEGCKHVRALVAHGLLDGHPGVGARR